MTTNEQRQLGRAKNAILAFFERRLSVPKMYIDAVWDGHKVDVLAIDRDGVGDVYAVLLFALRYIMPEDLPDISGDCISIADVIERFGSIPANFKYGAAVDIDSYHNAAEFAVSDPLMDRTFSPDGIGRVGFLTVGAVQGEEPQVKVRVKAERFRAKIAKLADDYIQQHEPDWQVRA
jgi:hypothetical protein